MIRLRRTLRYWQAGLGWPGMAGIGLLIGGLFFYWSAIRPAEQAFADLRERAAALTRTLAEGPAPGTRADTPEKQLATFYAAFPPDSHMADALDRIYAVAAEQKLELAKGEYRLLPERSGRLLRYRIILPIRASYPRIRAFLTAVVGRSPHIAVENIRFERPNIADPVIEADIHLLLYLEQST